MGGGHGADDGWNLIFDVIEQEHGRRGARPF